jgi:hypothetical protein
MHEVLDSAPEPSVPAFPPEAAVTRRGQGPAAAVAGGLTALAVIAAGAAAGVWFVPFAAGIAAGLLSGRGRLRFVFLAAAGIAAAGWAVPLAWLASRGEPVTATARAVAALAGLPASAALVMGGALLVAALQAVLGVWLGHAIRGRRRPR